MNKILISILFLCTCCFTGCLEDDSTQFFYELVPIENVDIPQLIRGETIDITISYFRPSDCHSFNNFNYERSLNERTVAVINVVIDNGTVCEALEEIDTVDVALPFIVGDEDSYKFKFWQGKDDQNQDQFLEIEVPVVDE